MNSREEKTGSRYQLRYAAGSYWILDMWQEGVPFQKPLAVNEAGAYIWKRLQEGKSQAEIAAALAEEFQTEQAWVEEDIAQFVKKLQECGISVQCGSYVE